ncbi:MAG: hypothetical protein RIG62_32520 [Cyclobacteriaceae bacterium]
MGIIRPDIAECTCSRPTIHWQITDTPRSHAAFSAISALLLLPQSEVNPGCSRKKAGQRCPAFQIE